MAFDLGACSYDVQAGKDVDRSSRTTSDHVDGCDPPGERPYFDHRSSINHEMLSPWRGRVDTGILDPHKLYSTGMQPSQREVLPHRARIRLHAVKKVDGMTAESDRSEPRRKNPSDIKFIIRGRQHPYICHERQEMTTE